MPETKNKRAKTCGYCGRQLGSFFYRDLTRARGYFCSGDHFMKFNENDNQPLIPGLKEDEEQSLMDVQEQGYESHEARDKAKVETPAPEPKKEEKKVPTWASKKAVGKYDKTD